MIILEQIIIPPLDLYLDLQSYGQVRVIRALQVPLTNQDPVACCLSVTKRSNLISLYKSNLISLYVFLFVPKDPVNCLFFYSVKLLIGPKKVNNSFGGVYLHPQEKSTLKNKMQRVNNSSPFPQVPLEASWWLSHQLRIKHLVSMNQRGIFTTPFIHINQRTDNTKVYNVHFVFPHHWYLTSPSENKY